jgi:serine/threonine-protein kinase
MTTDPLIGRKVGSYVVERKLGEGGMGAVYELVHPGIGKRLALKLLHAEYASKPQIVKRFFDEARAVNVIQHPNIVDIIDFAKLPDGSSYLTMEFLPGQSLGDAIRETGAMTSDEATAITLQICSALQAAHTEGITHRDLKPENIHLVPRPDNPRYVKVLDFGIAKLGGDLSAGGATRSGIVMGTPMYMSPEQAMGRTREIDHRTDIYALGVILYQMLVGRVPFEAESFGDLMLMHLQAPVPEMSQVRPDIPAPWNDVVQRALAKTREQRFQTMDEMAAAVRAAAAGNRVVGEATVSMGPGAIGTPPPISAVITQPPQTVALPSPTVSPSGRGRWKAVVGAIAAVAVGMVGVWLALSLAGGGNDQRAAVEVGTDAAPVVAAVQPPDAGVAVAPVPDHIPSSPADAGVQTATLRADAGARPVDTERKKRKKKKPRRPRKDDEDEADDPGTGQVKVTAVPWAYVTVNGKSRGKTPVTIELEAGRSHRIEVDNPDMGKSGSRRIAIREGKTENMRFRMADL